jgi:hypothetical protein
MKKKYARTVNRIATIALALLVGGCSSVLSPVPIGEPVKLGSEIEKWEGTWVQDGKDAVSVKVVDAERGLLEISKVDAEGGDADPESARIYITHYGDWLFANLSCRDEEQNDDDIGPDKYLWGRLKKEDRVIFVWAPDAQKFIELVKTGYMPGMLDYGKDWPNDTNPDVLLGPLDSSHLDRIVSPTNDLLFEWDSPMVLIKEIKTE